MVSFLHSTVIRNLCYAHYVNGKTHIPLSVSLHFYPTFLFADFTTPSLVELSQLEVLRNTDPVAPSTTVSTSVANNTTQKLDVLVYAISGGTGSFGFQLAFLWLPARFLLHQVIR